MFLRTQCSLSTIGVDALSSIFVHMDVASLCRTATLCRAFHTVVKENNFVNKAIEEHGISFPFIGHRYVENQSVYVFDKYAILNALAPVQETIRGVLTFKRDRDNEDCLLLDVQVNGESVHTAAERNICCRKKLINRISAFKTTRIHLFDSSSLSVIIFGYMIRVKVFNGKYKASYLLANSSASPSVSSTIEVPHCPSVARHPLCATGESLKDFSLSIIRAYKACFERKNCLGP
jgi:hypothetical protein